jgi:hypothetical protein
MGVGAGCSSSWRCDRVVNTRSTLRARARSGGRRVLGCGHPPRLCMPGVLAELHPRSTLQAVARRRGVGAVSLVMGAVGHRFRHRALLLLFHLRSTPRAVAREAGMGGVAIGLSSAGSTHNPPYEQLLIGLGAGARSMFRIGGRCRVSVTWHQEGGCLVLT